MPSSATAHAPSAFARHSVARRCVAHRCSASWCCPTTTRSGPRPCSRCWAGSTWRRSRPARPSRGQRPTAGSPRPATAVGCAGCSHLPAGSCSRRAPPGSIRSAARKPLGTAPGWSCWRRSRRPNAACATNCRPGWPGPGWATRRLGCGSARTPSARPRSTGSSPSWAWNRPRCPSSGPTVGSARRRRWSAGPGTWTMWPRTMPGSSPSSPTRTRDRAMRRCSRRSAWCTPGAGSRSWTRACPTSCCRTAGSATAPGRCSTYAKHKAWTPEARRRWAELIAD